MRRFCLLTVLLMTSSVVAQQPAAPPTAAQLQGQVNELAADDVAWRRIKWRTCLIEGLNESRKENKPVVLWVFIDRPTDDERC